MTILTFVMAAGLAASAQVDFSYSFATPHRITVALPDSNDKTLLDVDATGLRVGWSYESLRTLPQQAFITPPANWAVRLTPALNGQPFPKTAWTRLEAVLPALENTYSADTASMKIEGIGGKTATLFRLTMTNSGNADADFGLVCDSQRGFFGYNPAYVNDFRDPDCLLAGWGDRADRVIVIAPGADRYEINGATSLRPVWKVPAGQTRTGWLVRPYRAYVEDKPSLAGLRETCWQTEYDAALAEWRELLARMVCIELPDPGVRNAFYAGLADLFIMREPMQDGRVAATPGTDGYRAGNPAEAGILAVALDQVGLHREAGDGYQMCLEQQSEDGNWACPKGWGHLFWGTSGFKTWTAMEHYRLTGDKDYLEQVYPRMLASSRFQEQMRARTRVMVDGQKPLTYGLMPRGMGDCGLKDGDDLYGVFLPHNMWAVYADSVALGAAKILGRDKDVEELTKIYETARADLLTALDRGAIQADGYRWIPGVAGKTCGSRWGALNAVYPCRILAPDDPLAEGTLRHLRSQMSPGGLPLNTGWMPNGLWVAIALDNLAETHLVRNEGDEAADLLYATLNHATPLYSWCEERGPTPGAAETSGDRQHLWTPVSVVRELRDSYAFEWDGDLHLARGLHRDWIASGQPVGIADAPTHFGEVSFQMRYDAAARELRGHVALKPRKHCAEAGKIALHLRLPKGVAAESVDAGSDAKLNADATTVEWNKLSGKCDFVVKTK